MSTPKQGAPAPTPAIQPVPATDADLVKGGSGPQTRNPGRIAINHNQTLRVR